MFSFKLFFKVHDEGSTRGAIPYRTSFEVELRIGQYANKGIRPCLWGQWMFILGLYFLSRIQLTFSFSHTSMKYNNTTCGWHNKMTILPDDYVVMNRGPIYELLSCESTTPVFSISGIDSILLLWRRISGLAYTLLLNAVHAIAPNSY